MKKRMFRTILFLILISLALIYPIQCSDDNKPDPNSPKKQKHTFLAKFNKKNPTKQNGQGSPKSPTSKNAQSADSDQKVDNEERKSITSTSSKTSIGTRAMNFVGNKLKFGKGKRMYNSSPEGLNKLDISDSQQSGGGISENRFRGSRTGISTYASSDTASISSKDKIKGAFSKAKGFMANKWSSLSEGMNSGKAPKNTKQYKKNPGTSSVSRQTKDIKQDSSAQPHKTHKTGIKGLFKGLKRKEKPSDVAGTTPPKPALGPLSYPQLQKALRDGQLSQVDGKIPSPESTVPKSQAQEKLYRQLAQQEQLKSLIQGLPRQNYEIGYFPTPQIQSFDFSRSFREWKGDSDPPKESYLLPRINSPYTKSLGDLTRVGTDIPSTSNEQRSASIDAINGAVGHSAVVNPAASMDKTGRQRSMSLKIIRKKFQDGMRRSNQDKSHKSGEPHPNQNQQQKQGHPQGAGHQPKHSPQHQAVLNGLDDQDWSGIPQTDRLQHISKPKQNQKRKPNRRKPPQRSTSKLTGGGVSSNRHSTLSPFQTQDIFTGQDPFMPIASSPLKPAMTKLIMTQGTSDPKPIQIQTKTVEAGQGPSQSTSTERAGIEQSDNRPPPSRPPKTPKPPKQPIFAEQSQDPPTFPPKNSPTLTSTTSSSSIGKSQQSSKPIPQQTGTKHQVKSPKELTGPKSEQGSMLEPPQSAGPSQSPSPEPRTKIFQLQKLLKKTITDAEQSSPSSRRRITSRQIKRDPQEDYEQSTQKGSKTQRGRYHQLSQQGQSTSGPHWGVKVRKTWSKLDIQPQSKQKPNIIPPPKVDRIQKPKPTPTQKPELESTSTSKPAPKPEPEPKPAPMLKLDLTQTPKLKPRPKPKPKSEQQSKSQLQQFWKNKGLGKRQQPQ